MSVQFSDYERKTFSRLSHQRDRIERIHTEHLLRDYREIDWRDRLDRIERIRDPLLTRMASELSYVSRKIEIWSDAA